jgi:pimeloyl-ACP methyl ester carboxylesterase
MPYANNQGVRIHYRVEGNGLPLVLHHGFSDSLESWYGMGYVDPLKHNYRLILIDARGHGASDKPHDPAAYTVQHRAADVVAVLDTLAIPTAHFFGYSMGGHIGFALAKYAPTHFTSFIIGGASPYGATPDFQRQLLRLLQQGAVAFVRGWEQQGPVSPTMKARLLANDMDALIALWTTRIEESPRLEDVLPTMTMPCLLLAGEQDVSYADIKECSIHLPQGTLVTLPGLNHYEAFRQANVALPHLTSFLAAVSP